MEGEAKGKNFTIGPDKAQIFHVSAKRRNDDTWRFRDPMKYDGVVEVDNEGFKTRIESYFVALNRTGEINDTKMLLVNPMSALILYSLKIITVEQFKAARERSSGYFDLPTTGLGEDLPMRIAHHPRNMLIAADHNGYPVSSY